MDDECDVYGGDIPEDVETMEHDLYMEDELPHASLTKQNTTSKIEEMKKRIKDIEQETFALKEMHAKMEKDMGIQQGQNGVAPCQSKGDADGRSIFVGNVDYFCTPDDLRLHFHKCGTINRITIKADSYGKPKGFAYIEFLEVEAVPTALSLNETELRGRKLKVSNKRTNIPGMNRARIRGFSSYGRIYARSRPNFCPYPRPGYGSYGKCPKARQSCRFSPYG